MSWHNSIHEFLKYLSAIFTNIFSYFQYNDVNDDQPDEFLIDLIARYGQTIMNARNDLEK